MGEEGGLVCCEWEVGGKAIGVPLVLDDLAQAVEHAIVVFLTGDRGALLELTVRVEWVSGRGLIDCNWEEIREVELTLGS